MVESLQIENAVKKLIATKKGDEMEKRAAEYRQYINISVAEDRVSRLELNSFISHITRSEFAVRNNLFSIPIQLLMIIEWYCAGHLF